jgi:hypothetical protein
MLSPIRVAPLLTILLLLPGATGTLHADSITAGEISQQTVTCSPSDGCNSPFVKGKKAFINATFDISSIPNFTDKMTSDTLFFFQFGPNDIFVSGFGRNLFEAPGYVEGDTFIKFPGNSKPKVDFSLSWNDSTVTATMKGKGFTPFTVGEFDLPDGPNNTQFFARLALTGPALDEELTQTQAAITEVKSKTKVKSDGTSSTVKKFNKHL